MEAKTKAKITAKQAVSLLGKEVSEFLDGLSTVVFSPSA